MKKILKSKKGFTLIELLAVIVVLAIIMVIATQQINGTIKKSSADSLKSSLNMVVKQAKSTYIQYGDNIDVTSIKENVDYKESEYAITLLDDKKTVCLEPKRDGKFYNIAKKYFTTVEGDDITVSPLGIEMDVSITRVCKTFR